VWSKVALVQQVWSKVALVQQVWSKVALVQQVWSTFVSRYPSQKGGSRIPKP